MQSFFIKIKPKFDDLILLLLCNTIIAVSQKQ